MGLKEAFDKLFRFGKSTTSDYNGQEAGNSGAIYPNWYQSNIEVEFVINNNPGRNRHRSPERHSGGRRIQERGPDVIEEIPSVRGKSRFGDPTLDALWDLGQKPGSHKLEVKPEPPQPRTENSECCMWCKNDNSPGQPLRLEESVAYTTHTGGFTRGGGVAKHSERSKLGKREMFTCVHCERQSETGYKRNR
jgi:hypothetical protein